jgi:hypothetical protein
VAAKAKTKLVKGLSAAVVQGLSTAMQGPQQAGKFPCVGTTRTAAASRHKVSRVPFATMAQLDKDVLHVQRSGETNELQQEQGFMAEFVITAKFYLLFIIIFIYIFIFLYVLLNQK